MFVELWRSRLKYFRKHEPAWRYRLLAATIKLGLVLKGAGDRIACARGKITPEERETRAAAYRAVRGGTAHR
jgi:hypothetical protein